MLNDEISKITTSSISGSETTRTRFLRRLKEDNLTRDENPRSHFCVYFLPYNPKSKKVFIVHHRKSGLWLSPGGHIDEGEGLLQTLNREINEELGVKNFFKSIPVLFLLTITPIENPAHPCKTHYDIWYRLETNGNDFNIDPKEFHATKWMTIVEAKTIVTDPPNRRALAVLDN